MAITFQRTATVYRLWVDADLRELFEVHAAAGWSSMLVCHNEKGAGVEWAVTMQQRGKREVLTAALTDVVVSDLATVEVQTVARFNRAHPDDQIEAH